MSILPQTTQRRLKKIPIIPGVVWEGDRRSLLGMKTTMEPDSEGSEECVIWVDGSEGFVRAMDVVSVDAGPEAIVRTFLRAIETPHRPAKPARPQKIVVRNKEIHFFLRGVLQNLDIDIELIPELPLIDELFRGFEEMNHSRPPALPATQEASLKKIALELWQEAPWYVLADYDILSIKINQWGVDTLYACVMGMLGREYGVILYRSLDSLKQFRMAALEKKSLEQLEKAFLSQDCWFLSYESMMDLDPDDDDDEEEPIDLASLPLSEIRPVFGSVHPYEGIRPYLDEEEAIVVNVALQSLLRFYRNTHSELAEETLQLISKRFRVSVMSQSQTQETISTTVSTLPELSSEFLAILEQVEDDDDDDEYDFEFDDDDDDDDENTFSLREDLIPDNSFLSLGMITWDIHEQIKTRPQIYYQSQNISQKGDGMPIIMVQTTRPKAKEIIQRIQMGGGLKAIFFNPGEDPFTDVTYDLGILQLGNGEFYLFGEFIGDEPEHMKARKNWDNRCQKSKGYCGLIIAMGVTGSSRGNPQLTDMLALFETQFMKSEDLEIGVLQLLPHFD
ncbi:hypothetical protein C7H19_10265 [Aphanothece hegewaldii CCALA 016]|uniref:Uncharacterized protein n=1 Tax=Aphanothece hegewaldii CCALA 016 TaxID=2107694 RepID=A0A2T1LYS2_9CHRO|nr:hypothetical protein [Aphanothece hegewaldii]PSF37540.1 hypothetical protein C7H19_10265 [Aphanothece hegewaldii CCALA 016]